MPTIAARWKLVCLLGAFALAFAVAGCGGDSKDDDDANGLTTLTIKAANGKSAKINVEIADNTNERSTGLMNRDSLAKDNGMLFIIDPPIAGGGFYMKDTRIALTVAFIGPCGAIVALADMEPLTLTLHSTNQPYNFGLEANKGWFAEHGLGVGSTVTIPDAYKRPGC
ncbi:MAG TPA: DUF192 domain-containing protein [Dehalococcoidia bacterium]|nr:DUF192 domain-containing protein [Dehalococcoidia bacterium]